MWPGDPFASCAAAPLQKAIAVTAAAIAACVQPIRNLLGKMFRKQRANSARPVRRFMESSQKWRTKCVLNGHRSDGRLIEVRLPRWTASCKGEAAAFGAAYQLKCLALLGRDVQTG
jgi:hypothetical protein